jgi:hypothetical protein
MTLRIRGLALISALAGAVSIEPAHAQRGWWPRESQVSESPGSLAVTTPYYRFEHDLTKGGAIRLVSLTHGRSANLLVRPMESRVGIPLAPGAGAQDRRTPPVTLYSDLNDAAPVSSFKRDGKAVIVSTDAALRAADGRDSGVRVRTTYNYRWGYVRIHKEFRATRPATLSIVTALSTMLDPSLSDYGYRPGVAEEVGTSPFTWQTGQIREWGKVRPGTHFDLPFRTRYVPRYIVLVNPGVEGIEWFMSDRLEQWDYQITGQPGTGYCELSASTDPMGIRLTVDALNLPGGPLLAKGGKVALHDSYALDYYLGVPILEGHAQKPWLHESLRGIRTDARAEAGEDLIRKWADSGIREVTVHNDGDGFGDGLFWRDGSYPPYPPEVMKKLDAIIGFCHKHGVRIAPYFSNHELHQSTEAFQKHGGEWGRQPDDQGNLRPNTYYGSHMCLKSGWLDFFKSSVERVLSNHKFHGVYYDWNVALYCNNPLHVGKERTGASGERGLAALSLSPTGHWDIDELIQLVEWTRERVGPEGLFIIHNTLVPMFATENFADHVVGMEFMYGRIAGAMPRFEELPPEWAWAGARSRAVIVGGTVAQNASRRAFRQHALAGLMTAVTPWRANAEAIEFVGRLKPLGDIESYRFADWRNPAVSLEHRNCYSAIYSRQGEAYVLLANFHEDAAQAVVKVDPGKLAYPLRGLKSAMVVGGKPLDAAKLAGNGAAITIPGDGVVIVHLQ